MSKVKTGNILKATCIIDNVRYYKNNWGILDLTVTEVKEGELPDLSLSIVAKGQMPEPKIGMVVKIVGEYINDPKYGDQYNITQIYNNVSFSDSDNDSKRKFIESLYTPAQVAAMYEALEDPFKALDEEDVKQLVTIRGCGIKTANMWIRKFKNYIGIAKILTELSGYELTNNITQKLMDTYHSPELVIDKVKNNPYVLCTEVKGIGWKKADQIALDGGLDLYDPMRIEAYITHYLDVAGENGGSWIEADELLGAIIEEIGEEVPDERITEALKNMTDHKKLWSSDDKSKLGLMRYYNVENKIAQELIRLRDAETYIKYGDWMSDIRRIESNQGWEFTDEQIEGVKKGLSSNVTIVTGLGGTGKSTVVRAILEVLKDYSFAQCALSGRASSRLSEITGEDGSTIHRLLEYNRNGFNRNKLNPLDYDIYIVDEISMIDSFLFYNLLSAIPSGSKVFLLGDPGQLESIGSGNIAHDMIESSEIPTVYLTKIHRQAAKSAIITESIKVRNGVQLIQKDWVGKETRGELQDLSIECFSDASNTYYQVMKAFSFAMDKKGFDIMENQIITPVKNRTQTCTYEFNSAIQELYNPHQRNKKETTIFGEKTYVIRVGDKVINNTNNYNTDPYIYNGNIGIVKDFTEGYDENGNDTEVMVIDFKGIGTVEVPSKYWRNIELAYAITVHKSQGDEYNNVIFALDFGGYSLLTRELVYTGITRAKKHCTLIAQSGALRFAVGKNSVNNKQTHLQQCLYDISHPKLIF